MIFSNFFFFIVGLWTLHDKESIFPIIMVRPSTISQQYYYLFILFQFIFVVAVTILLDIIQLGVYFGSYQDANGGGHSESFVTVITHDTYLSLYIYSCNSKNVELLSRVCAPRLVYNYCPTI